MLCFCGKIQAEAIPLNTAMLMQANQESLASNPLGRSIGKFFRDPNCEQLYEGPVLLRERTGGSETGWVIVRTEEDQPLFLREGMARFSLVYRSELPEVVRDQILMVLRQDQAGPEWIRVVCDHICRHIDYCAASKFITVIEGRRGIGGFADQRGVYLRRELFDPLLSDRRSVMNEDFDSSTLPALIALVHEIGEGSLSGDEGRDLLADLGEGLSSHSLLRGLGKRSRKRLIQCSGIEELENYIDLLAFSSTEIALLRLNQRWLEIQDRSWSIAQLAYGLQDWLYSEGANRQLTTVLKSLGRDLPVTLKSDLPQDLVRISREDAMLLRSIDPSLLTKLSSRIGEVLLWAGMCGISFSFLGLFVLIIGSLIYLALEFVGLPWSLEPMIWLLFKVLGWGIAGGFGVTMLATIPMTISGVAGRKAPSAIDEALKSNDLDVRLTARYALDTNRALRLFLSNYHDNSGNFLDPDPASAGRWDQVDSRDMFNSIRFFVDKMPTAIMRLEEARRQGPRSYRRSMRLYRRIYLGKHGLIQHILRRKIDDELVILRRAWKEVESIMHDWGLDPTQNPLLAAMVGAFVSKEVTGAPLTGLPYRRGLHSPNRDSGNGNS